MNKHFLINAFILLCMTFCLPSSAELYQWTDKNGKVHYSDRKPAGQLEAQEISKKLTPVNIDSSRTQNQALGRVFPKTDNTRQRLDDDKKQKRQAARDEACKEAKDYLKKLDGRVRFIDDDGKPVNVSEAERKQRVIVLKADIKKNCR